MKMFKDKKVMALLVILLIFTIGYFVFAIKASYAFSDNINYEENYSVKVKLIKKAAKKYAQDNKNIFDKENIVYIKVQDLIDNNVISGDEQGNIYNDTDNSVINSNVIKIKLENDEITVEFDS